jgi:hypothetical protein
MRGGYTRDLSFSLVTFFWIKPKESNPPEAAAERGLLQKVRNSKKPCGRAPEAAGEARL